MQHAHRGNVVLGKVMWSPVKSLWWTGMVCVSLIGGWVTFSWPALALFLLITASVLLFGHSLGSHRKLIHDSFDCPLRPELRSHDGRQPIATTGPRASMATTLRSILATSAQLLARRGNAVLQGPCIALSEQWLRRLAGAPVSVVRTQAQARLVLHHGQDSVCGLPALLIAIGSRNAWAAAAAIVLLPLATMCELVRGQFQA
jgi:hypothetical protein